MSFKNVALYPANPNTTRGAATKLSASKNKIAYANGKSIIIRDLNNPSASTIFSGHVHATTVARVSPSGYYCASADASGTVKVWDIVGEDQVIKGDYKVISGRINDVAWDGESKRIIAVGEGREKFGHAFMMDTGTSSGEIAGHSKVINAVSIRHQRPFRAATAGDDTQIIFYQGAPYKYEKTIKTHTKFVQDVQYAPSGELFASVGSDSKIFIYDGKTGDTVEEITDSPHKGSVMACSWSPDSRSLLTSSMDRTVKLWDIQTRKMTATWTVGQSITHQQVGNTWSGEKDLVSLSMSGDLNVFDSRASDKPARIFQAPQKAITTATLFSSDTFLVGSADGRIHSYETSLESVALIAGDGHSNLVSAIASTNGKAFSAGYDDRVREIETEAKQFTPASFNTASQPKSIAVASDGTAFISETGGVEAVRDNQRVFELKANYSPSAIAVGGDVVAIGGEDHKVHHYSWDGKALKETFALEGNRGPITAIAVSGDGKLLASGDSSGKILLFDVVERKLITNRWTFHTARITSLSFLPQPTPTQSPTHLASGSLDTNVYIWSIEKPSSQVAIKNAASGGASSVLWLSPTGNKARLVSTGADACARIWEVVLP
ncbi:WD40-repeat-containing domain protein [Hygrophoropsis aurantiaca]|uniref:WD40-repeat-containing domain protein n=1 Tax=Hygrophoropsis aurantiaca TaxID=72124 RepID=A0ACB8AJC2_9AGAM|nr:WD40-repeat-containing domain protein [Hygrophoropsis aurantiaca]